MSHRNARLTVHGRRLLVHRVRVDGQAVAHVAKAMGVSRQCAHRWVARYDAEVLADYPDLEHDDLLAALEYGALAAGVR